MIKVRIIFYLDWSVIILLTQLFLDIPMNGNKETGGGMATAAIMKTGQRTASINPIMVRDTEGMRTTRSLIMREIRRVQMMVHGTTHLSVIIRTDSSANGNSMWKKRRGD